MAKTSACDGFAEDYSALLDGELEAGRAAQVRAHAESCAHCRPALEALRGVDPLLRAAPAPVVPTDLRARLQARIDAEGHRGATARPAPAFDSRDRRPAARAPRLPQRSGFGIRTGVGIGAAAAFAAGLALVLLQPGGRDEPELAPEVVAETKIPLPPAPPEQVEEAEIQVAVEPEPPTLSEPAPELVAPVAEEVIVVAEAPVAEEVVVLAEETLAPPELLIADATPSEDPIEDPLDLEGSSDQEVAEIALALQLDTLEDLDVIANLELLERLIALEEGTG